MIIFFLPESEGVSMALCRRSPVFMMRRQLTIARPSGKCSELGSRLEAECKTFYREQNSNKVEEHRECHSKVRILKA
jgi:hypothetical protein